MIIPPASALISMSREPGCASGKTKKADLGFSEQVDLMFHQNCLKSNSAKLAWAVMMTYVRAISLNNRLPTIKLTIGEIPTKLTTGDEQVPLNVLLKNTEFTSKVNMLQTPSLTQSSLLIGHLRLSFRA